MIYYVDLYDGYCGLSGESKSAILRRYGTDNVRSITPATQDQIAWVRAMGGYVPEQKGRRTKDR